MTKIQNKDIHKAKHFFGFLNSLGVWNLFGVWDSGFGISERQRGFTLFYAVLVASLMLAIGLAIFNITFKEFVLSSGARDSAGAFYAADTGLECALYWDLKHLAISSSPFGSYGDSLASGLLGYWRFEDGTGSLRAADSSGAGNNGTLTSMDSNVAWVAGKIGGAVTFDGLDDYIDIADGPGLSFANNQQFSVSFWFRSVDLAGMMLSFRSSTDGDPVIDIALGSVGVGTTIGAVKALVRDDSGGGAYAIVNGPVANNGAWHHVAITRGTGGRLELFLDGTSRGSNSSSGADGSITTNLKAIGSERRWVQDNYDTVDARFFTGTVDDVRIYNRVLSQTEITQLSDTEPNLQFVQPVNRSSSIECLGADISDPSTGWDPVSGWDVATTTNAATTTFDITFTESNRCATVAVIKNSATTTITSRGYNNCDLNDPRRVERAIKATY